MASNENLYKKMFRCLPDSFSPDDSMNMSPMSSLTRTLLLGASLTPRKRLSLSSSMSDTPTSFLEISLSSVNSNNSVQSKSSHEKISKNKENAHTPYYSPSHRPPHRRKSPLKELQNTVNRNLGFSPLKKPISPSKREHLSPPVKKTLSVEQCDSGSRDSGFSESDQKGSFSSGRKSDDGFFSVPRSCAPSRKLNLDMSPLPESGRKNRSFASLAKKAADEDEFLLDLICGDFEEEQRFASLLSAPITSKTPAKTTPSVQRLPIRRCLSMIDNNTPLTSRTKSICTVVSFANSSSPVSPAIESEILTSPSTTLSFKRPQPPSDFTPCPVLAKRRRSEATGLPSLPEKCSLSLRLNSSPEAKVDFEEGRPRIHRSHSESHVSIMKALNNSTKNNGEMTGDFSRPLALPVIDSGKHPDLKAITVHTLARLLKGEFEDQISSFQILDCRYPYEFNGGHIRSATNWFHPKMVVDHLEACDGPPEPPSNDDRREILIFHCEFSAERGPKAQRLLREVDRRDSTSKDYYPRLHFPELYLLEGGYSAFFDVYPQLCSPVNYVRMVDESHCEDFKFFRSKSKSWTFENKFNRNRRTAPRDSDTGLNSRD